MTTERPLLLGSRRIGPGEPSYVIAEVGLNHNGSLDIARHLVDAAISAGADAVKFQKRKLRETYREELIDNPRSGEQGLQYTIPLLVEFELDDDSFRALLQYCQARGITAMCTPWDFASIDFLETCGLIAYKIGSPDFTNVPLIEYALRTGRPLLLSTGMSSEEEIRRTLAFLDQANAEYALFHCVSTYPAAADDINLRFMERLREWSGRPVGYSGHDTGFAISVAAVAMGARMIERHLTLDRTMRGPDHKASLEPGDFTRQVLMIREAEAALGVPHRWITRGETLNRRVLGKSIVAAIDIPAGTPIQRPMLTTKSPGLGLSPQFLETLIGRVLARPVARDEMLLHEDLHDAAACNATLPINVGSPWGVVARFTDFGSLERIFLPLGMTFVEFHVSDRDLDIGARAYTDGRRDFGFVLHAPEYCHDTLIDLCADDEAQRTLSVARIQKTIALVRDLASHFRFDTSLFPRGPKVVVHVGGMSPHGRPYDVASAEDRLLRSLRALDTSEIDLLLENLPPYPWYFGGKWHGHVLCSGRSAVDLCERSGLGLCFDSSHAALQCARDGSDLMDFVGRVLPHVRHVHVSDAAGTSGEGLQIGEGAINFVALLPPLLAAVPTIVPEIWMGHHEHGAPFRVALERLTDLHWAGLALNAPTDPLRHPDLEALIVPEGATLFTALRVIDMNRMGIAFAVDAQRRVVGVVTDGDIRHAFVRGLTLGDNVCHAMTRDFAFGELGMTPLELRGRVRGRTQIMPIVDSERRLVAFAGPGTLEGGPHDRQGL